MKALKLLHQTKSFSARASKNARTNYDAICPKCKYEWNNAPQGFIPLKEEPIIEEEIVELEEEE
jgi:hypothetical protein